MNLIYLKIKVSKKKENILSHVKKDKHEEEAWEEQKAAHGK